MAKEMCVTKQIIYKWEQGLSKPHILSKGKLISLCKKEKIRLMNENYILYKQKTVSLLT